MLKSRIVFSTRLLFFFILIFFSFGCKKDQKHNYISATVKDLGFFQKQSYWIFINENTQEIDCTYVVKYPSIWTERTGSNDEPLIDNIFVEFNGHILYRFQLVGQSLIGFMPNGNYCELYYGGIGLGQSKGTNSIYTYVANYDTLTINSTIFYSVYHTRYSTIKEYQSDTLTYDFYLVPHIGPVKITKKLAHADTTYTLIRYNVIQ
jgi:hypothetical protein